MDDGGIRLGVADEAEARRLYVERHKKRRTYLPAKVHRITVNAATGERVVESDLAPPKSPPLRLVAVKKAPPPQRSITDDAASKYLRGLPFAARPVGPRALISLKQITDAVATVWSIDADWLFAPTRKREYAYPRFAAMALVRDIRKLSTTQIGKYYGGRDHTTALAALRRAKGLLETDPEFAALYNVASVLLKDAPA